MAGHLLVTLADENYLDPVRQLFACVHWNAGWDGDLMLLSHGIPQASLDPFEERGILVRSCDPWVDPCDEEVGHPPTVLSKFDVFSTDFRRWDHVLFLDADMMFWASLSALTRVRGLAAVSERRPLSGQFSRRVPGSKLARELESSFDLDRPAFNSGLLAFDTSLIRDDTVQRLRDLYLRFRDAQYHSFGDQPALNLHFQGRWRVLPDFYAAIRDHSARHFFLEEDAMQMIGKHFAGEPRPWDPGHPRYAEWRANLDRFETLDARRPQPPRVRWSALRVQRYVWSLGARRGLGLMGEGARAGWKRVRKIGPVRRLRGAAKRLRSLAGGGD
jgi:hypothetical protein